jgi:hypothetical protein
MLVGETVRLSMLKPRAERRPEIFERTPDSLSTRTARVCCVG